MHGREYECGCNSVGDCRRDRTDSEDREGEERFGDDKRGVMRKDDGERGRKWRERLKFGRLKTL